MCQEVIVYLQAFQDTSVSSVSTVSSVSLKIEPVAWRNTASYLTKFSWMQKSYQFKGGKKKNQQSPSQNSSEMELSPAAGGPLGTTATAMGRCCKDSLMLLPMELAEIWCMATCPSWSVLGFGPAAGFDTQESHTCPTIAKPLVSQLKWTTDFKHDQQNF